MLQSPWDERLWSLFFKEPEKIISQIVQENLCKRRNFRLKPDKSGPDDSPLMPTPPSGEWSGEYKDMTRDEHEHEVKYKITFEAGGKVQGSAMSTDGDQFRINGTYSLRTGIVAWNQHPCNPKNNVKEAEFYGDVFIGPSGPARITGTFVTGNGRYCVLNLVDPTVSKTNEIPVCPPKVPVELPPHRSSPDALPTLLAGGVTPIKAHIARNLREGRPAFFPKM